MKTPTGMLPFTVGLAIATLAACAYAAGGGLTSYSQYTLELTCIYIVVTAGLNIAVGLTGQFQMAQPALMAISAYGVSILVLDHGWSLWVAGVVALVVTTAVAAVVGLLTTRLRTHYLLLGTFALQVIVVDSIRQFDGLTGGVNGHPAPVVINVFGTQVSPSTKDFSLLVIAVAAIFLWLAQYLSRSNLGLIMRATRHSNLLLQSTGTNPARPRLTAVVVSGLYAGVGGFFVAPLLIFLSPDSFSTTLVLLFVLMVVIGGSGSVTGVAVGTAALNWVLQTASTSGTAEYWPIVFGLVLMCTLIVAPGGLASLATSLGRRVFSGLGQPTDAGETIGPDASEQVLVPDSAASMDPLTIRDVGRRYGGVTALTGVSFEVLPGTVHGLIGPNGSGKTTLLDIISGFNRADEGSVSLGRRDITQASSEKRSRLGIRRSFQHPLLIEDATALENVLIGESDQMSLGERMRLSLSAGRSERLGRARAVLEVLGLGERAMVHARDLSYGERKLLDIGRALVARPQIIVMDEPAAGLPGPEVNRIESVVRKLNKLGYGVIIVEHNMSLIMGVCARVTVLANGHHLITDTPDVVQQNRDVIDVYLGKDAKSVDSERAV